MMADDLTAIRRGDYKLFFGSGVKHSADPNIENRPALFNLATDPGETNDISSQHSVLVKELLALARHRLTEIRENHTQIGVWTDAKLSAEATKREKNWGKWLQ